MPRELFSAVTKCHPLVQNGILYFLIVITAVGQNSNILTVVITDIFVQIQSVKICDKSVRLGHVRQSVFPTVFFRIKRNRRKRDYYSVENQKDIRPLMSDHKSLSVIEFLHVFGFQTVAVLKCAVNEKKNMPRKSFGFFKNLRIYFRLFFRQVFQGVHYNIFIIL